MPEGYATISEVCAEFGVTQRTLRYYEYIELLAPRRDGTRRLYSARDRARLSLILRGRKFGFSLEAIRQWLALYNDGRDQTAQVEKWIESAAKRLQDMERERAELAKLIDELRELHDDGVAWLDAHAPRRTGSTG
ncbi:MAG: MerR family DNA-binding transcriptional regulator [Pseudomonadota bacterium]